MLREVALGMEPWLKAEEARSWLMGMVGNTADIRPNAWMRSNSARLIGRCMFALSS